MSHEFVVLADTGETRVFCDRGLIELDVLDRDIDFESDLAPVVDGWTRRYAATDDKHDPGDFAALPEDRRVEARGSRGRPYLLLRA